MSNSNRRAYLTATVLDQDLLDACHDNLECKIEMVCEIESPDGWIYASDRNKYVGGTFYEALLNFPQISRTLGEWLSGELQFSNLTLTLSNVDGRFNKYLPAGEDFTGWIGKAVIVKIGLAESASTYVEIFTGRVTPVGGFKRGVKAVTVVARDNNDLVNVPIPTTALKDTDYPKIETKYLGKLLPIIYGDYTTAVDPVPGALSAFVLNGHDPFVHFTPVSVLTNNGSPGVCVAIDHDLDNLDIIQFATSGSLPVGLTAGINYFVRNATADSFNVSILSAGSLTTFSGPQSGDQTFLPGTLETRLNVQCILSENDLASLNNFYLKRQDTYYEIPASQITNIGSGNKTFEIIQDAAAWLDEGAGPVTYKFAQGDEFVLKLKGKDLTIYSDNPVWIARDILMIYGGLIFADFNANWATFRDKMASVKARAYIDSTVKAMTYALSILEQVRLEAAPARDLTLKINSLQFDDFNPAPSFTIKNWDVEKDSFKTSTDITNYFNRAQAPFNLLPNVGEEAQSTAIFNNGADIAQSGQAISKKVSYPNLYVQSDVETQIQEVIRLASTQLEVINVNLTWRSLLIDIGDFVKLDVKIGSAIYENVPCMVRSVGVDPQGLKVVMELWSLQMVPFPGWSPGYAGIVGGDGATITKE